MATNKLHRFFFLTLLLAGGGTAAVGQATISVSEKTDINEKNSADSLKTAAKEAVGTVATPTSLTFSASTDQRFFFFGDTRNDNGRRIPVSVYGVRAGFLFPSRRPRPALGSNSSQSASFKAGAGFYFLNQTLDQPGLLPGETESVKRYLRIATVYYERYLYRHGPFEVSLPIELGYGHSRYERTSGMEEEVARGVFVPLGVGISGAYHFPNIRWFKPFHWFGLYLLVGQRFILKKDLPDSQINYGGFYVSAGPSFFLESLTGDLKDWGKKRKKRRENKAGAPSN